jgi:hypothetical protein
LVKGSFPRPLFPKPFGGIAFIESIKAIPTYFCKVLLPASLKNVQVSFIKDKFDVE